MSKVLAIDYGKKRCGFAISDEDQSIAFPLDISKKTSSPGNNP